jgi:hypothetical protein
MDLRLLLFPLVVIPLCIATFLIAQQAWRIQRRSQAARGWVQTSGRVIRSGVRETAVHVRRRTSTSSYRQATRYEPEVVYEYQAPGGIYRGDRLQLGYSVAASEVDVAQRQADRYPINAGVTVYYQPDNPAESALSLTAGRGPWVMWGTALIMLAVTLFMAVIVWNITL